MSVDTNPGENPLSDTPESQHDEARRQELGAAIGAVAGVIAGVDDYPAVETWMKLKARLIIDALDTAGYEVVAKVERCPGCGSDDKRYRFGTPCFNEWHGEYLLAPEDRGIHVETYETHSPIGWDKPDWTEYRWRVRHSNGKTMASGEGYADARDRDHAVSVLFPGVPTKEVEG